jgi:hypothetical protein
MVSFREIHRAVKSVFGFGETEVRSRAKHYPISKARHAFVLAAAMTGRKQSEVAEWLMRSVPAIEHTFNAAKDRHETEADFRNGLAKVVESLRKKSEANEENPSK